MTRSSTIELDVRELGIVAMERGIVDIRPRQEVAAPSSARYTSGCRQQREGKE